MTLTTASFVETQFPNEISYSSTGGPSFSTTIFTSTSGFEQRNVNWSMARAEYDVSQAIKTKDQMDTILAFFWAMMGKAYAFRYKDWADFQITNQSIINTTTGAVNGDGTTKTFQIIKSYVAGSQTFNRTIVKPVTGSLTTVTVAGAPTTAFTLDYTTGIITFTTAPANGAAVIVTYIEFDVPVRFDTDVAAIRQDFYMVESWEGIKLVEVKLA